MCSSTPGDGERVECENTDANPVEIELDGVDISTTENNVNGVFLRKTQAARGAINFSVIGSSIKNAASSTASGVYIRNDGTGDTRILVRDSSIEQLSENGQHAIRVWEPSPSIGNLDLQLDRARLSSAGGHAVDISKTRPGDVRIRVRDSTISTTGSSTSSGLYVYQRRSGAFEITVSGGSIETSGKGSGGIVGHKGPPETNNPIQEDPIVIAVDGVTIRTAGGERDDLQSSSTLSRIVTESPGIGAGHRGSGPVDVSVRGGSIIVSGADQHGIMVGGLSFNGNELHATSARDEDGYRRQTVWVDGPVSGGSGTGAGVYLGGGGRVIIGPDGRVGALSGTAVRAGIRTGQAAADDPKLHVELRPGGRPISDLLKGNIVNEGGASYTTVAVNGVMLMDGVWALNGVREVALRTGTDGGNIAVADFLDRWAPRAAVYEALPGFLLRLDEAGGGVELRAPDAPLWLRVSGGMGSYRPESASTGARHRHTRYGVEAGADFPLDDGLAGWAGVRAVSGSARVSAATGGGRIEALGVGLAAGLSWEDADGFYGTGRVSLTRYGVDLSSSRRGRLAAGAAVLVHALDLEGGRRYAVDEEVAVTPWARLGYSGASMGGVTDAEGSRISIAEADRRTLGVGADAEIELDAGGRGERLALRGSFGLERALGGGTAVRAPGGELESKAPDGVRVLLGVGASWRAGGGVVLSAGLRAAGVGSKGRDLSGSIGLGIAF